MFKLFRCITSHQHQPLVSAISGLGREALVGGSHGISLQLDPLRPSLEGVLAMDPNNEGS